ncbi:hypothetical protein WJ03_30085 [Burkholderia vietnamiensis]|nr:hypothetical protein WJ03_30085 [Burkholderia vietnamiensis]
MHEMFEPENRTRILFVFLSSPLFLNKELTNHTGNGAFIELARINVLYTGKAKRSKKILNFGTAKSVRLLVPGQLQGNKALLINFRLLCSLGLGITPKFFVRLI